MDTDVVGRVKALAFVAIGDGHFATAVGGENRDAAVTVFAGEKTSLIIKGETIGAGFVAVSRWDSVAGGFEKDTQAVFFGPLIDFVGGNVREEEAVFGLVPDRAFGPLEAHRDDLDPGVFRDQFVDGWVETLDGADGRTDRAIRSRRSKLGKGGGSKSERKNYRTHVLNLVTPHRRARAQVDF